MPKSTTTTDKSIADRVDEVVKADRYISVDEAVRQAEEAGVFDETFTAQAERDTKREIIRRVLRSRRGKDQWPLFANLTRPGADGKPVRLYIRETYMRTPHYAQVVEYWSKYTRHGARMANGWAKRNNARYDDQLQLPFPELDDENEVKRKL